MKVVHTSDWHLGHRLYNYDRSDEEAHFFAQLADLVAAERPDALLVCGDVFHTGSPGNDVARSFTDRLLDVATRCPEMATIVIAGNHDSYSRLAVDEALWRRCRVRVFGTPAEDEAGNALLDDNIVELPGKGYISAVPFCHARNFPMVHGADGDDRAKAYFNALAARLAEVNTAGLPCVLVAHLAAGRDIRLAGQDIVGVIGGEECVDPGSLGSGYDYMALGHIHCPQWVRGGGKTARYCGTPRAIHFDETHAHGVDVVEVAAGREASVRTVEFKPLRALRTFGGGEGRPFEETLAELASCDVEPGSYIRLNVSISPGELPGADWTERARAVASDRGLRFCLVNPIRRAASGGEGDDQPALTVEELQELSPSSVLDILAQQHALTDRQRELVMELLEDIGK